MDVLEEVKKVFRTELNELENVSDSLGQNIVDVIYAINDCTGKVIISGMGKPGHIAKKYQQPCQVLVSILMSFILQKPCTVI